MALVAPTFDHNLPRLTELYGAAVARVAPQWLAWACGLALLATGQVRKLWAQPRAWVRVVLLLASVVGLTAWAWHLASCFDEAFLPFRCADNLAHGAGLTWNPGEGASCRSPSWTLVLAAAIKAGLPAPQTALVLCLVCFVLELVVVASISRRWMPRGDDFTFPIAAVILGASYSFASYGTSGTGTMFATLLATLALERVLAGSYVLAGVASAVASLAMPGTAVLAPALGLALVTAPATRAHAWRYVAPFIAIYVPCLYLGATSELFQEPFAAGRAAALDRGVTYLASAGLATGAFALVPLAAYAGMVQRRDVLPRYAAFVLPIYAAEIVNAGGDGWIGHLLVPVLPILALLAERGARELFARGQLRVAGTLLAGLAFVAAPIRMLGPSERLGPVVDAAAVSHVTSFRPFAVDNGSWPRVAALEEKVATLGVNPIVAEERVGAEGYFSRLPMVDLSLISGAGTAPQQEKLRDQGVLLSQIPLFDDRYAAMTRVSIKGTVFYLGGYDARLVDALRPEAGVEMMEMPAFLDRYVAQIAPVIPAADLAQDIDFFDQYYFSHATDPARRERLAEISAAKRRR